MAPPVAQHTPWYRFKPDSCIGCTLTRIISVVGYALFVISIALLTAARNPYLLNAGFAFSATLFTLKAMELICLDDSRPVLINATAFMFTTLSVILFAWGAFGSISPIVAPIYQTTLVFFPIAIFILGAAGLGTFLGLRRLIME